jgi:hypothetical protein
MLTLTAAATAMTISNMTLIQSSRVECATQVLLSEEAGTQIKAYGSHGNRNYQSETAKYAYQDERVRVGLGLCSFASENNGNDRIHGSLLIETTAKLHDRRCRSFARGEKMASPMLRDCFVGNLARRYHGVRLALWPEASTHQRPS